MRNKEFLFWTLRVYFLIYKPNKFMWGQRTCDPGPLYVKVQGPSRGGTLLRTYSESTNGLEIQPRMILSSASQSTPERKGKYGI